MNLIKMLILIAMLVAYIIPVRLASEEDDIRWLWLLIPSIIVNILGIILLNIYM